MATHPFTTKIITSSVLILLTIILGILLHKAGKPYNTALFTIHKLAAVSFVVLLVIVLSNSMKLFGFQFSSGLLLITAALAIIALFLSGAMMSIGKMHETMFIIHRASTLVFVVCIAWILYKVF